MSASVLLNIAWLLIVAFIVYRQLKRQYERDRKYFGDLTARPQKPAPQEEPVLNEDEVNAQYTSVQQAIARFPLPSVRIRAHAGKIAQPWQSKFGGVPNWPKHEKYPLTPDGKPLYMLAQLNLAEMRPLPGYPPADCCSSSLPTTT